MKGRGMLGKASTVAQIPSNKKAMRISLRLKDQAENEIGVNCLKAVKEAD